MRMAGTMNEMPTKEVVMKDASQERPVRAHLSDLERRTSPSQDRDSFQGAEHIASHDDNGCDL